MTIKRGARTEEKWWRYPPQNELNVPRVKTTSDPAWALGQLFAADRPRLLRTYGQHYNCVYKGTKPQLYPTQHIWMTRLAPHWWLIRKIVTRLGGDFGNLNSQHRCNFRFGGADPREGRGTLTGHRRSLGFTSVEKRRKGKWCSSKTTRDRNNDSSEKNIS